MPIFHSIINNNVRRWLMLALMCVMTMGTVSAASDDQKLSVSDLGYNFWSQWNGTGWDRLIDKTAVKSPTTFGSMAVDPASNLEFELNLYLTKGSIKSDAFSISNNSENSTLAVNAPKGYVITNLTMTFADNKGVPLESEITPSSAGSVTIDGYDYTWTGSSDFVKFTFNPKNSEVQIENITLTYHRTSTNTNFKPWTPILSLKSGTYIGEQRGVTITNEQSGVEYYFRKSGSGFDTGYYWTGNTSTDDANGWYKYPDRSINIDKTTYLYVVAVNSASKTDTTYTSAYYVINDQNKAPTPSFYIDNHKVDENTTYRGTQNVEIRAKGSDLGIFYHVDANKLNNPSPSNSDLWTTYLSPLVITESSYIYAYAGGENYLDGDVAEVHVTIDNSSDGNPNLEWRNSKGNAVESFTVTYGDEPYNLPVLNNPHNLPVVYSISGAGASRVATIDPINGTVKIIGTGTVNVTATYTTSTGSKYYSQAVVYQLVINPKESVRSLTFFSGDINDNTLAVRTDGQGDGVNSDPVDVPDGTVVKIRRSGYPDNYVFMAKLARMGDTRTGYPAYELKKNGKLNNFEEVDSHGYTKEGNFEYIGNGIPVYRSDEKDSLMFIQVRIYDPTTAKGRKKAVGQFFINLRVHSGNDRPLPPVVLPVTYGNEGQNHHIMTLSEASSVQGEPEATIFAKYSSSATYTPRVLLAMDNLSIGKGKVGVYSTELNPDRRTSAIQVRHNCDWGGKQWDIASDPLIMYYIYTPNRHEVRLEAVNNPIRHDISDKNTETLQVDCYIDGVKTNVKDVDNKDFKYTFTSSRDTIASVDKNGVVTFHNPGVTIITVSTPQIEGKLKQIEDEDYSGTRGYEAASTVFTVFVTDKANHALLPPTFSPATNRNYHAEFKASVVANTMFPDDSPMDVGEAYYILVDDSVFGNSIYKEDAYDQMAQQIIRYVDSDEASKRDHEAVFSFIGGWGKVNVNKSGSVSIPITHKNGTGMSDDDSYTIYAVTYNKDTKKRSSLTWITFYYEKLTVDDPVLVPGYRSPKVFNVDSMYTFVPDDSLIITASTTTPGARIYYTINSISDEVNTSTGHLYVGSDKIRIGASSIIRAVAYLNGVYSNVVTYYYRKGVPNIQPVNYRKVEGNTAPIVSGTVRDDDAVTLQMHALADVNSDGTMIDVFANKDTHDKYPEYVIYYTTDGSNPTHNSYVYDIENPPTFESDLTIWAFCMNTTYGSSSVPSRIYVRIKNGLQVWKADSTAYTGDSAKYQTCYPDGTLKANVISRDVANFNQATAPAYITITVGRDGQKWGPSDVAESYKGRRIDGYGTLDIIAQKGGTSTVTDADDELGILYNHAYAQLNDYSTEYKKANSDATVQSRAYGVYESTFRLPSHGTYVKFEPERDGEITIWCEQNGGMHYSNAAQSDDSFYNQFLRKRPAYLVDELGRSIPYKAVDASGMLNPRWGEIDRDALLGMNGMEDGLLQTLFEKNEAQDLYDLYNAAIRSYQKKYLNNNTKDYKISIRNLIAELNDGSHQVAASAGVDIRDDRGSNDYVIDGTGYCLPSASYMKYTFPVRAGKTYFFFAVKTKIGISALGFKPTEDATQRQGVPLDGTSTSSDVNKNAIANALNNLYKSDYTDVNVRLKPKTSYVQLERSFTAGKWAALALPFSMSATQVQKSFGEGTIIQHFYGFEDRQPVSYINMAQHDHQMIVAGTPVFIRPAKDMNRLRVEGVQIEKTAVENVRDQRNGSSVVMSGTFDYLSAGTPLYGFYVQRGRLVQARAKAVAQMATRAWLQGFDKPVKAKVGFSGDDPDDDYTDGIITVDSEDDNRSAVRPVDDNIYSINGMIVGRGESDFHRLPPGVYIYKGSKKVFK